MPRCWSRAEPLLLTAMAPIGARTLLLLRCPWPLPRSTTTIASLLLTLVLFRVVPSRPQVRLPHQNAKYLVMPSFSLNVCTTTVAEDPCTTIFYKEPCNGTVKFDYDSCTTRDSSDAKFNDASSSLP
ncbi:hypothetical protein VPH35_081801 [Triticum aestivum]